MQNNPLAVAVRQAFLDNVINKSLEVPDPTLGIKNRRLAKFCCQLNMFFTRCGQPPVAVNNYHIDEKDMLDFVLKIGIYMGQAQKELQKLNDKFARDRDVMNLFKHSNQYAIACSNQIPGNKYVFNNGIEYDFWKIDKSQGLFNAEFKRAYGLASPQKNNLIIMMPFHVSKDPEQIRYWTYRLLHNTLDNKEVFNDNVDIFMANFPIEKPRNFRHYMALKTLQQPHDFFEKNDIMFVKHNLTKFIGKNIRINDEGIVTGGEKFDGKTLADNFKKMTFLGYCGGGYYIHRTINALYDITRQIYGTYPAQNALRNIFVLNYAFLPPENECLYSGAHFMCNREDNVLKSDPYLKMCNPEEYEKVKYTKEDTIAKVTMMNDKRNFIIACKAHDKITYIDKKSEIKEFVDPYFGHEMGNITRPNLTAPDNFPYRHFRTVLENAVEGIRGAKVFMSRDKEERNRINDRLTACGIQARSRDLK